MKINLKLIPNKNNQIPSTGLKSFFKTGFQVVVFHFYLQLPEHQNQDIVKFCQIIYKAMLI